MSGFENDVVFALNADFTQADNQSPVEANGLITNGQIWIGSTTPNGGGTHIRVGTITSPDSSINIGYSSPNITIQASSTGTVTSVSTTISGSSVGFTPTTGNAVMHVTDASSNTLIGELAGNLTLSGNLNTGIGYNNLNDLTTGAFNNVLGANSLPLLTTGQFNVALGYASGNSLVSGSSNTLVGSSTGLDYTSSESGNILIGNDTRGVVGESNVTRIGNAGNSGATPQSACFIDGITGVTTSNSQMVTIDSTTGQLGVATLPVAGIETINGDSGSITGATVTIQTNVASLTCGSSVLFTNSGTTSTLSVTDSNNSTFLGSGSGKAGASGTNNCGFGVTSMSSITSGNSNMGFGTSALASCTSGEYNVGVGVIALQALTTTSQNTAIGRNALGQIVTGANNIAIGYNAGAICTTNDSNNIHIGNVGVAGDNAAIKLGTNGTHTTCFVQGINGVTVTGTAVLCSTAGQLGTVASSERYKENIEDMQDNVSVMHLRPVKFNYKQDENKTTQYGLIAEDVDRVFPYLCFYKDGQPESVKYHELCVFLLAEVQRLNERVKRLESV